MNSMALVACLVAGMAGNFGKQKKKKKRNPQKNKGKRKARK